MVKLLVNKEEVKFTTTVFPDGTSQVWKVEDFPPDYDEEYDDVTIFWMFENEAELFQVAQLANLIEELTGQESHTLVVPYLPYGRQDKDVMNNASFALNTFKDILYGVNICRVETFDAHSNSDMIYSTPPTIFHKDVFNHDIVCFPDKGAATRYKSTEAFGDADVIYCEKSRNQETGEITGLHVVRPDGVILTDKSILIVDDICDGGMTFIKVAEALNNYGPKQIDLAVSHGLFSKGKDVLHQAGITKIFTTNSLLRNKDEYKIW